MEINKGKYLHIYDISPKVSDDILVKIKELDLKKVRRESIFSYSFMFLSFILLIGTTIWAYNEAAQTGLLSSLSLIFTDGSLVISYWKDFTSFIIESLPFVSLISIFISFIILILATVNLKVVRQSALSFNY